MDRSLAHLGEIIMPAGTTEDSVAVRFRDWYRMIRPGVGRFTLPEHANGKAKPALKHFADPFALDTSRNRLWGQVRAGDAASVTVQRRLKGSKTWKTVKTVHTDSLGYWSWHTSLRKGASYRYQAAGATSSTLKRG